MRLRFSILFLLAFSYLTAQIQVLPDMEVIGESQVKIFLYKKALPYSHQDAKNDSLSAFLPTAAPVMIQSQHKTIQAPKRGFAMLGGSTVLDINGYLRYHLPGHAIRSLGLWGNSTNPEDNYAAQQTSLWADITLSDDSNASIQFPLFTAQADNFGSEYYSAIADIRSNSFQALGLDIKHQNTGLRAYKLWQKNLNSPVKKERVAFRHSHEVDFGIVQIGNDVFLNDGIFSYHQFTGFNIFDLAESKIHFLVTNNSFIPSIGFRYRNLVDFDSEFRIQNQPELIPNDYPELLDATRWVNIAKAPLSTLMPWNLKIMGEKHFTANPDNKLKSLGVELASVWKKDDPILVNGINPKVPEIGFTDAMMHSISMMANFEENEVTYSQSLSLNAAHASDKNWQRLPYHPILKLESVANFSLNQYDLDVALKQHYFSRDENDSDLPEFIDFGIGLGYQFGRYTKLQVKAENLLNSPQIVHRTLPERGLAICANISHHF